MFEHGRSRLSCWYSAIGFLQIELGAALDAGRDLVGSLVAGEEVWELVGEDLADGSVVIKHGRRRLLQGTQEFFCIRVLHGGR